jgi:hypothetical protein
MQPERARCCDGRRGCGWVRALTRMCMRLPSDSAPPYVGVEDTSLYLHAPAPVCEGYRKAHAKLVASVGLVHSAPWHPYFAEPSMISA